MKRISAFIALLCIAGTAIAAQALPLLSNWQADSALASGKGRPLVLFFSLPGCRFCAQVRQNYMLALERRGEVVREVVIDSDHPVTGLAGAATHRAVARKMGASVAPVVILVDARGQPLADPIVGGDVAGLYGGYLDNAFDEAQRRLAKPPTLKAGQ
jgi:thioredoxin-related protein